jgi:hypothetical protein
MNIVMRQTGHGIHFEALCDLCREPMDMTETVDYVTPRLSGKAPRETKDNSGPVDRYTAIGGDIVCHSECNRKHRIPGWAQMATVESLLNQLQERRRNRHPALAAFIKTLNERNPKPIH